MEGTARRRGVLRLPSGVPHAARQGARMVHGGQLQAKGIRDIVRESRPEEDFGRLLLVTTKDLAKQFGVTSMTIKRHIAKMPHIRYVGSGYSGYWEVLDDK